MGSWYISISGLCSVVLLYARPIFCCSLLSFKPFHPFSPFSRPIHSLRDMIGPCYSFMAHYNYVTLVHRNYYDTHILDMPLEVCKASSTDALLAKFLAYGFTPSFCKLISSFLSNRFISVVVDSATSASYPVSSGVPQGSVFSPNLFLLFINDLHATASDVQSFADDSSLRKSSSFQCQPSSNARSQSHLAMSSTINSDLQSISEWGTCNLVKFNTSKTQLLTISLSNTPSNYPIIFEDSEILPLNSINILGLQISCSLSKLLSQPQKNWGFSFGVNNILILLNYSNCILVFFFPAWNIALISGVLPLILLFLIGLNQRLSAWLVIPRHLTLRLFASRWLLYLSSTSITLVTALMNGVFGKLPSHQMAVAIMCLIGKEIREIHFGHRALPYILCAYKIYSVSLMNHFNLFLIYGNIG